MPKNILSRDSINRIITLRKTGHSLLEIKKLTKHSASTVFKYIKGVRIPSDYIEILKSKQGGSKRRAKDDWIKSRNEIKDRLGLISNRDKLIFLAGIYWGEGTKRELNLINGDPYLIKSFIKGLMILGVKKKDIKLNFRIFEGMNENSVINFWKNFLKINNRENIGWSEFVRGNNKKRLPNGMCRVRVIKSGHYFKLLMSMIDFIKQQ